MNQSRNQQQQARPHAAIRRTKLASIALLLLIFLIVGTAMFALRDRPDAPSMPSSKQARLKPDDFIGKPQPKLPTIEVALADEVFHLEVAHTSEAIFRGLSDRPGIDPSGGMLFVLPDYEVHQFCMRRCLVPIDLLFLDAVGRITTIHHMQVEPYDTPESKLKVYPSHGPALFAIELKAGTIQRLGLEVGDPLLLPLDRLKRLVN